MFGHVFALMTKVWQTLVRYCFGLSWIVPAYFAVLSFLGDGKGVRDAIGNIWRCATIEKIQSARLCDVFETLRPSTIGWDLYLFAGGVGLATIYGMLFFINHRDRGAKAKSFEQEKLLLVDQNKALEGKLSELQRQVKDLSGTIARYDFFKVNLGLLLRWYMTCIWHDLKFGNSERMTLYRHDAESRSLISVDRQADNLAYRQIGREVPLSEDCILTRAWQTGIVYHGDLPNPKSACKLYKKRQKQLGCRGELLKVFKMKPRTYFAWRIAKEGDPNPVAVIMVESDSEKFRNQDELKTAFQKYYEFMYMFIDNFGAELPSLPIAEKAGF